MSSTVKIFFFSLALSILSPAFALADEGSIALPSFSCKSEKIFCKSYQDKNLCEKYLTDPSYTVAGGWIGASVQEYEFCKASDVEKNQGVSYVTAGIVLSLCVVGLSVLFYIRQKTAKK